jgi:DNA polymerase-3 subunit alpha
VEQGADVGKKTVTLGGVITDIRVFQTKKGDPMCSFHLEDAEGGIAVTVFPRDYEVLKGTIQEEQVVLLTGEAQYREQRDEVNILCSKIEPIQSVEEEMDRQRRLVWLTVDVPVEDDQRAVSDAKMKVSDLYTCLRKHGEKGHDSFEILVRHDDWLAHIAVPENTFAFTPALRQKLVGILGEKNIEVQPWQEVPTKPSAWSTGQLKVAVLS